MEIHSAGGSFTSAAANKHLVSKQAVTRPAGPGIRAQSTKSQTINAQQIQNSVASRPVSPNQAPPQQPFSSLENQLESQQMSVLGEAKKLFGRAKSGVSSAKAAAVSDRAQGISISDGLLKYKKSQDAATLFSLAGQVLAANGISKNSTRATVAAPVSNRSVSAAPAISSLSPASVQPMSSATQGRAGGVTGSSTAAETNPVIKFEQPSDGTPWTVAIDRFGQRAQALLQLQSQQLALDYLGKQTGLDLVNMPLSSAADKVFGWLAGDSVTTGSAGSGGNNAVSAGGIASATGAQSGGQLGNQLGAAAAPEWGGTVLGAIGAAYSAFQLIDNWGQNTPAQRAVSGATIGAYVGTQILPGVGTLVGAGIGGLLGAVAGMFGGHKHKDQLARDRMREQLQQIGFIDQNFGVSLADGSSFDISLDKGKRLQNIDGTERRPYEADFSNPLAAQVIGWIQPLTKLLFPNDQKLKDDLTGYLTNAALSNVKDLDSARKNVMRFYDQLNLTPEKVVQGLLTLGEQGSLTSDLQAYLNGIATLLSGLTQPSAESREEEAREDQSKTEAAAGRPDPTGQVSESIVSTQTAVA